MTATTDATQRAYPDLVDHLARTTSLTPAQAARVVTDVLAYFGESTEQYVRRRHREMQAYGHRNEQIFTRLADELATRRVAPGELSQRQLRRIVYG